MSFDGLRTVKADSKDTALEGMLVRYGGASAQIAFATGTLTGARHQFFIDWRSSLRIFSHPCRLLCDSNVNRVQDYRAPSI